MIDRQRIGPKLRMGGEEVTERVKLRIAQPRQCHVRREFALLRLQTGADQRLLDLVAQPDQFGAPLDPDPQRMRPASAEHAGAGQLQREFGKP